MVFCLGTEGSKKFPIKKWVVPMFFCKGTEGSKVPYLETGGSIGFLFRN